MAIWRYLAIVAYSTLNIELAGKGRVEERGAKRMLATMPLRREGSLASTCQRVFNLSVDLFAEYVVEHGPPIRLNNRSTWRIAR